MTFDMLASIELSLSSAIAIAAVAESVGTTPVMRLRLAVGLGVWFVLVVVMAATEVLTYPRGVGVPGLGVAVALPVVVLSTLFRRVASLRRALQDAPLHVLIGMHAIRVLGVYFLILYAAGRLPAPFAPVAGWGDILTGLAAMPLGVLAYWRAAPLRPLILIWNAFGLLDLVVAIGLGATSSPGPIRVFYMEPGTVIMTTLPWLIIPGFLVPLLASTHLAIFHRLTRDGKTQTVNGNTAHMEAN